MSSLAITAAITAILSASGPNGVWEIEHRFQVGQELFYEGRIHDEFAALGVSTESDRRLAVRALVLDRTAKGLATVGVYTVQRSAQASRDAKPNDLLDATAVHFAKINCSGVGHPLWSANNAEIAPPVEDSMIAELGFFLEGPDKPVRLGDKWVVRHPGQPNVACEAVRFESVTGTPCLAVEQHFESQNWSNGEISLPAWQIKQTVWFEPKAGCVFKIDRTLETRRPETVGHVQTRHTVYELATNIKYHGNVFQNMLSDFQAAHDAQLSLERALAYKDATRSRLLLATRQDLKSAMQRLFSTPYRPAIEWMNDRAEAAEKYVADAEPEDVPVLGGSRKAHVGQRAPNFVVRSTETGDKITGRTSKGQTILMVFVDPTSKLSRDALQTSLLAIAQAKPTENVRVLAVCPKSDSAAEEQLRKEVPGKYEVCSGMGTDGAYGIKHLPHVVLIDHSGVLRMNQVGFGPEVYAGLVHDLAGRAVENIANEKADSSPSTVR